VAVRKRVTVGLVLSWAACG